MNQSDEITIPYPQGSAGIYLVKAVPTSSPDDTAAQILRKLAEAPKEWDSLTYIFVLDTERKPVGVVSIEKLYASPPASRMSEVMRTDIDVADPNADQEEAVVKAVNRELDAMPVVDSEGRFIGAIDHDGILDILHREHIEDILRLSGIHSERTIVDILRTRTLELVRLRVPWLVLGLVGGMLATIVVNFFESALEKELALAFFIPVIVYMSDAVGTQTETIFIRSLSLGAVNVRQYLAREAGVGLAIALVCSALISVFAAIFMKSLELAMIVGLAMFMSIFVSVFVAVLIPWLLNKLKRDPAFGSGPFATIIQDILSLTIYFLVATLILF
jgi:magnesium transporter